MSRDNITAAYVSSSVQTIRADYLAYLDFGPSGSEAAPAPVRLWTGLENKTFTDFSGSATYLAVGTYGGISAVTETTEVSAKGIELTLSGIPQAYLSATMQNRYRGRPAAVYLILWDATRSSYQQTMVFRGRMDQMIINEGSTSSTITVKCESRLIDFQRPVERRYTNEYQTAFVNPEDTGLEFIYAIADKIIYWGMNAPTTTISLEGAGGGSGDGNIININ
jgi:hypothetical protein